MTEDELIADEKSAHEAWRKDQSEPNAVRWMNARNKLGDFYDKRFKSIMKASERAQAKKTRRM